MVNRDARACYTAIAAELGCPCPDAAQRAALRGAVRCRAGAQLARTKAGSRFCEAALRKSCALHRARDTGSGSLLLPEQAELRGVAGGLGEAEMFERVRREQAAARG